ncbi:helix-turn-helix transcriptional regulator [Neolewinella lacunae]|uniref:Helix-turn-helix transcriptional regulator n=1 Tax=Neolewinella lacunae TaxID=1517758 RepID=A0A923T8P3_9BACT|nr:helix-turn-helix transcriptional regulator [Neolewinella lacunae]MBC6994751.1 helix-turn-helix transcriptional regulator [Neolewinella lacunae]MDN3634373.1 helix-turn-helix transcriptional regulator [Neolewinella lacunae]
MQELITDDARYTVNLANDIVDQIYLALQEKNWTQKDLADALGKSPSEISKWLQPSHNFTCRTIGKLSAVFGKDLVVTPLRYDSMNGQLLPFGQQRNRAYVAARNARFQGEVNEQPSAADSAPRYNFDISELLQGRIETSIITEETPAPAESPNYAMAA